MSTLRPIFLIAGNTITGILRGVVLNVLLVLGSVMIIGAMTSSAFKDSEIRLMLVDSGLAVITILGALIAILTGFTMIPSEIENRTLYPVLTKGVRRWQFVLGKFLGSVGINGIVVGLLSILFFIVYKLKLTHQPFDGRLIAAVLMIFFMLMVLSGIIIFFSTFMSWIGTIIVSMVIWIIGSYSQFIYDLGTRSDLGGIGRFVSTLVQKLFPNFQSMDLRFAIVQQQVTHFTAKQIGDPLLNGCIYLVITLALAVIIFNYREL
jgi:ABC-type transport system involved in multi-copper enzyme maturation permease subunit